MTFLDFDMTEPADAVQSMIMCMGVARDTQPAAQTSVNRPHPCDVIIDYLHKRNNN